MVKRTYPLLFLVVMIFFSCSDADDWGELAMGGAFITSQTSVVVIDSMTPSLSTFMIDSIPSNSSLKNLMIGRYNDEYFGEVSSTAYFELTYPDFSDLDTFFTHYDSLVMIINYNGIYYGDTTKQQTIYVHQVLEEMEEPDEAYMYNTTTFKYSDEPIGSVTFTPCPNFDDTLSIRMNDEFGKMLLNMMKEDASEFDNMDYFLEFLRGIALVPGDEDASILGFEPADSAVILKLYAHEIKEEKTDVVYEFPLYNDDNTTFNNFKADRSGTYLEGLNTQKNNISSGQMDNKAYVQGGTGIVTRLDFGDLTKISQQEEKNVLYKAELVLRPYADSDEQADYPEEIMLYTTDQYNRLVSELQNDDNETLIADFNYDEETREDIHYTFDITNYLLDVLDEGYDETEGLVICFPSTTFMSTTQRLVLDARNKSECRPILRLYFLYYDYYDNDDEEK